MLSSVKWHTFKLDWAGLTILPGLRRWEFIDGLEEYEVRLLTDEFRNYGLK